MQDPGEPPTYDKNLPPPPKHMCALSRTLPYATATQLMCVMTIENTKYCPVDGAHPYIRSNLYRVKDKHLKRPPGKEMGIGVT